MSEARPPRVSVSLVTYNHAPFIRQALDSVLRQQADFAFDVVAGDDCSTDGTREILCEYEQAHPGRIRLVLPDANLGDAGRPLFLETLKHCRGGYIAALDGDDFWTGPDKLQRQADFLDAHPDCSLCYHDAVIVAEDGPAPEWTFIPPNHPEFATAADLIHGCFIPACSSMVRRDVVEHFPPWFFDAPWADLAYYLVAARHGRLGLIREPLGAYRIHAGGVWSRLGDAAKQRSHIEALGALEAVFGPEHARALAQARSRHHFVLARHLARGGSAGEAARHLALAVRHDPTLKLTRQALARRLARVPG